MTSITDPVRDPVGVPVGVPDLLSRYRRDGFAVVPGVLDTGALDRVRAEALAVCRGERGDFEGLVTLAPGTADDDVLRRYLCIHFPHKMSQSLAGVSRLPSVVDLLTAVIGPNVKLVQSMLFIKSEGRPGQAWHQDEYFIPTRDRSLTAAWIALDDATVENGCLWVIPGSHRAGVLYPDREHGDDRFDCSVESYGWAYRDEDAVPVEVPAGAAVLFNGYLLHRSLPNTGRHGMRRALVSHYMSAESLLPWYPPGDGEWMGKADFRDIEIVAGADPYAHRETVDVHHPHVRPDRSGGCLR
jgi:hypothetical protein